MSNLEDIENERAEALHEPDPYTLHCGCDVRTCGTNHNGDACLAAKEKELFPLTEADLVLQS